MSKVILERFAYTPQGTFGRLKVNGFECYTIELPWDGNRQQVSCIPEGVYDLRKRVSPVVQRSTGGIYKEGYEVAGVPGRSYIMIHPGNTIDDFQGCIGPGTALGYLKGKWAVTSSRTAFDRIMAELDAGSDWQIEIVQYRP